MKIWHTEQGTRIQDDAGKLIAMMGVFTTPEDCALVSAAPELLAACLFARQLSRGMTDVRDTPKYLETLNAAIAKAEGR